MKRTFFEVHQTVSGVSMVTVLWADKEEEEHLNMCLLQSSQTRHRRDEQISPGVFFHLHLSYFILLDI